MLRKKKKKKRKQTYLEHTRKDKVAAKAKT